MLICKHRRSLLELRNDAVLLGQAQDAVVALAHATDLAADGPPRRLARDETAGLRVDVDDVDLDGGLVLRVDDARRGRALAGNLQMKRIGRVRTKIWYRRCL